MTNYFILVQNLAAEFNHFSSVYEKFLAVQHNIKRTYRLSAQENTELCLLKEQILVFVTTSNPKLKFYVKIFLCVSSLL